jgi:hypothetical protein
MADKNEIDRLELFYKMLMGKPGIREQTKAVARAVGQGRAEVHPDTAHKLRPGEDQHALEIILDSLRRTLPARTKGDPPNENETPGVTEDQT